MTVPTHDICAGSPESVFERCSWFYALCRELLFTDHTDEIASTMTPLLKQSCRPVLLEVAAAQNQRLKILNDYLPELFVRTRRARPACVILDIDASDDPTHGQQVLSFYHGHYEQHQYFPL